MNVDSSVNKNSENIPLCGGKKKRPGVKVPYWVRWKVTVGNWPSTYIHLRRRQGMDATGSLWAIQYAIRRTGRESVS